MTSPRDFGLTVRILQEAGKKSAKRKVELLWYRTRQKRWNGRDRYSVSKQNVTGLWNNFDFGFSQKINAQNGTCHSGLQKTRSEKFALKLDSSLDLWMNSQGGIGCPSAPLRRGPDGLEFEMPGIMLKVAPVSTKNLSLVNSSVRKISPALAGKCIAVAVACAGMAAEPDRVRRHFSFPRKYRA